MVKKNGGRVGSDSMEAICFFTLGIALLLFITLVGMIIYTSVSSGKHEDSTPELQVSDFAMAVDSANEEIEQADYPMEESLEEQQAAEQDYYEPYYPSYSYPEGEGLTMSGGVYYHDGRRETWYSSNVLRHYRTSEWTLDDEGFYRDADGYYVVAASDLEQGTVFEGSKGKCKVHDSGCADGTTDYYVGW